MAEECGESSVAISSSSNWWENIHGGPTWAWQNHGNNPSSDSPTCEDDVSISNSYNTNTSIHSGLTVESSHRLLDLSATELILGEHMSDNQLWSHMLLGIGNNGENYVDSSSTSKSMSNYFIGSGNDRLIMPPSLSDNYRRSSPVNDWSIAPPISGVNYLSLNSSSGLYPSEGYHKQYGDIKAECEIGYEGFQDTASRCRYGSFEDDPVFVDESLSHKGNTLGQHHAINKPSWKSPTVSDRSGKKQGAAPPPPAASSSSSARASNVKGQAITNSESKKKKPSDGNSVSTGTAKKHKHESSTASAARMQVTKAKLGDRITALQQIVSPFGKTDTASVLTETVGYIKFLQEQVRLLVSNPYLKPNPHKDLWGGLEREERVDMRVVELRSKGLCLVPVSCTPQVYRDNMGSDYWTPPYRSLLYR